MGLDIRIPIGSLFVILGALLAGYGAFSSPAIYQRSLGINVNLWWGGALLVFGFAMLALAWRAASLRRGTRDLRGGDRGAQGSGAQDAGTR